MMTDDELLRLIAVDTRIWKIRHFQFTRPQRHRRWLRVVGLVNSQIEKYTALNRPETVTRLRSCLDALMAERCIACGKFWHVGTDKHASGCRHAKSKR